MFFFHLRLGRVVDPSAVRFRPVCARIECNKNRARTHRTSEMKKKPEGTTEEPHCLLRRRSRVRWTCQSLPLGDPSALCILFYARCSITVFFLLLILFLLLCRLLRFPGNRFPTPHLECWSTADLSRFAVASTFFSSSSRPLLPRYFSRKPYIRMKTYPMRRHRVMISHRHRERPRKLQLLRRRLT